jgi:hypothetical protein
LRPKEFGCVLACGFPSKFGDSEMRMMSYGEEKERGYRVVVVSLCVREKEN